MNFAFRKELFKSKLCFLLVCTELMVLAGTVQAQPTPARTLVVYNSAYTNDQDKDGVQDSLEVAQYYLAKRGIPSQNLLGIAFANVDYIVADFPTINSTLFQPIKNKLAALGPQNIDLIVMGYQTPWNYEYRALDSMLPLINYWTATNIKGGAPTYGYAISAPYFESTPGIGTDVGHFTHAISKYSNSDTYLVGRIDGPGGVWRVLDMVDQALYAERYLSTQPGGYTGNAYIDSKALFGNYTDAFLAGHNSVKGGDYSSYAGADINIAWAEHFIAAKGLPLKWEDTGDIIGGPTAVYKDGSSALTAPRALLYGGWYNFFHYEKNAWEWLPGSVGIDLNSNSLGYTIRNEHWPVWGSSALNNGITATAGVISEPYTLGHPRSTTIIKYLLDGYTFGEASALGNPYFNFVGLSLGDPLYTPYKAKPELRDTTPPQPEAGFPRVTWSKAEGHIFEVVLKDTVEPEVSRLTIEYGKTPALGSSAAFKPYYRHLRGIFPPLEGSTTYYARGVLSDPVGNVTTTQTINFTTPAETPFEGAPQTIPGTFKLYKFDEGGEGVAYHDMLPDNFHPLQPRNDTGVEIYYYDQNQLTSVDEGDWLKYTVNITQAGSYTVNLNVIDGFFGKFHLDIDGVDVSGVITKPNFNGPGTVSKSGIQLPAGTHVLRVSFDEKADAVMGSFDSIKFVRDGGVDPDLVPPSPPTNFQLQ